MTLALAAVAALAALPVGIVAWAAGKAIRDVPEDLRRMENRNG